MANIRDLRTLGWYLFKKNKAEAKKFSPTKTAVTEQILRAHHQAMIWLLADIPDLNVPSPTKYGWNEESNQYMLKVSDLPAASTAVMEQVKCECGRNRCT